MANPLAPPSQTKDQTTPQPVVPPAANMTNMHTRSVGRGMRRYAGGTADVQPTIGTRIQNALAAGFTPTHPASDAYNPSQPPALAPSPSTAYNPGAAPPAPDTPATRASAYQPPDPATGRFGLPTSPIDAARGALGYLIGRSEGILHGAHAANAGAAAGQAAAAAAAPPATAGMPTAAPAAPLPSDPVPTRSQLNDIGSTPLSTPQNPGFNLENGQNVGAPAIADMGHVDALNNAHMISPSQFVRATHGQLRNADVKMIWDHMIASRMQPGDQATSNYFRGLFNGATSPEGRSALAQALATFTAIHSGLPAWMLGQGGVNLPVPGQQQLVKPTEDDQ